MTQMFTAHARKLEHSFNTTIQAKAKSILLTFFVYFVRLNQQQNMTTCWQFCLLTDVVSLTRLPGAEHVGETHLHLNTDIPNALTSC